MLLQYRFDGCRMQSLCKLLVPRTPRLACLVFDFKEFCLRMNAKPTVVGDMAARNSCSCVVASSAQLSSAATSLLQHHVHCKAISQVHTFICQTICLSCSFKGHSLHSLLLSCSRETAANELCGLLLLLFFIRVWFRDSSLAVIPDVACNIVSASQTDQCDPGLAELVCDMCVSQTTKSVLWGVQQSKQVEPVGT